MKLFGIEPGGGIPSQHGRSVRVSTLIADGAVLVWLVLGLAAGGESVKLVRRAWPVRRQLRPSLLILISLVAASATFGAVGTALGFAKAYGLFTSTDRLVVDPSHKARVREGIFVATNCSAVGFAIWGPSIIAVVFVSKRSKRRVQ
jgi:hypothetical protein